MLHLLPLFFGHIREHVHCGLSEYPRMVRVVPRNYPHAYAKVSIAVEHVDGVTHSDVSVGRLLLKS